MVFLRPDTFESLWGAKGGLGSVENINDHRKALTKNISQNIFSIKIVASKLRLLLMQPQNSYTT